MKTSRKNEPVSKNDSAEGRQQALQRALESIHRQYGAESLRTLGDQTATACEVISTGSLTLDAAVGVGGIPTGRIVEFYGPESSGKTTLALHVIASAQKKGGVAAFVDAEHALDPSYARKLGVNLDELLVSQPDSGEQALEIVELLTRSGGVDVIVVDSVAALTPQAEIEGEMGDSHVGLQARLMSQGLRKLTAIVNKTNTTIIFINQIRMKIGVMFGSPETTTGGNALKFYASMRLDIRRIGTSKSGDIAIGNQVKVKVVKNKVAAPFRIAEFEILFNRGINREGELVDLGVGCGIVEKSGSWFSYGSTRLGQGRDKACDFLAQNPEMAQEIADKLRAQTLPVTEEKEGAEEESDDPMPTEDAA